MTLKFGYRSRFIRFGFIMVLVVVAVGCGSSQDDGRLIAETNRGVALMGRFDYEGARTVFAELVVEYPDNADLLVNLAIATLNRQADGDEREAVGLLNQALEIEPENLRARYCRGLLALHAGEADSAIQDFGAVLDADADDADAMYFMGQSLMQDDRVDEALEYFQRAIDLDPYLRSAYYRGFQALQRLGRRDEAKATLELFKSLENNPRGRVVEFKYTRMGRRADALPLGGSERPPVKPPEGALFASPIEFEGGGHLSGEANDPSAMMPSMSVSDLDGDGNLDLFLTADVSAEGGSANRIWMGMEEGGFRLLDDHPLLHVDGVNAVLWGDVDNDGLCDVYLCRVGPNQLWRATGSGDFEDVTAATGTSGGEMNTVDGVLIDADHDGDLDLYLVNSDGPNELLNNDRDGSFRALASELGLQGETPGSRAALFVDIDNDRDSDLIVISEDGRHEVFLNNLMWSYDPSPGWVDFRAADIVAAVAADVDADGTNEIYTVGRSGQLSRWPVSGGEPGVSENIGVLTPSADGDLPRLAVADVDGDASLEILATSEPGIVILNPGSGEILGEVEGDFLTWTLANLDPARGPSLLTVGRDGPPSLHSPGSGRYPFAALEFSGKEDDGASMRSNASGIGTSLAVRIGPRWTALSTLRSHSGPGQDLQPLAVGLAGADRIDFVAMNWSDGVFQTEMNLLAGELHSVMETQRQLSSCPVLFAWDGKQFAFVSDVLGVGGMGYAVGYGEYADPRPWENLLLPPGVPAVKEGRLTLKLGEPMEEAAYLDEVRLVAHDLPPGWSVVVDDRMAILGPEPTGRPMYYRRALQPLEAHNDRGEVVTETILVGDLVAAPVGTLDLRFIGRLENEHVLTLTFEHPLHTLGDDLALIADGWVEYPYSQTSFAAWQADAAYEAPTLEARGRDGVWRVVYEQFGYPAGMPRRMALPLPLLPEGTQELRLRTNQEIYWDRLEVVAIEECPQARSTSLTLVDAQLSQAGFAFRTTGDQRLPSYDYSRRAPVWDTRSQEGWYTRLGPVSELLSQTEGAFVIFGPGEEVHMEFEAPRSSLEPGWTRAFVFESRGWCKDMDLYTKDGETIEPLPGADLGGSEREALLEAFTTRYREGRD